MIDKDGVEHFFKLSDDDPILPGYVCIQPKLMGFRHSKELDNPECKNHQIIGILQRNQVDRQAGDNVVRVELDWDRFDIMCPACGKRYLTTREDKDL